MHGLKQNQNMGWIGVDLDGTLNELRTGQGTRIGVPARPMMQRIRRWLREGREVRIFTARAATADGVRAVQSWLRAQGLPALTVTNMTDSEMLQLWEDRAIRVVKNTGKICAGCEKRHALTAEGQETITD
ncbi:hypothetical protein AAH678_14965 [Sodalis endosymbiont of Spalangia cameroni]|uniref:hypothetical protein n=1 Tax=Sodalis praecaptivus TaxID=1239307 RepID=UPI0031F7C557